MGAAGLALGYSPEVNVFDGIDWFAFPSLVRAMLFLHRQSPDVVLFQWWTGAVLHNFCLLAWFARRINASVVVEIHELQDTGEARLRGVAKYVARVGTKFLNRADAIIVHSEYDRDAIAKAFSVPRCRTTVLPHGPYDQYVERTSAVDSINRNDDITTLLFFGTIRPYKGLEHLVEAFSSLDPGIAPLFRLLIVGETWEGWTKPLQLVERSPYRDQITVVNRYVSNDEVKGFFDLADAVVLPYTRSSASGPLHIAMSCGLPVILSDVGGLRQGAEGYEGITWVEPSSPERLRAALVEVSLQKGTRFTDVRSWQDTVSVFDTLITDLRVV